MIHEFQPRRVSTDPVAFVTKNKQRIKQYNDTVYLNNGDEFEIELFNPTSNKVLAKIELNGKSIGSGIVLRPGERVFLERYINEARKFLFETYVVNGNNADVQRAIANNGTLNVKFYNEHVFYNNISYTYTIPSPTITIWPPVTTPYHRYDVTNYYNYTGGNGTLTCGNGSSISSSTDQVNASASMYMASLGQQDVIFPSMKDDPPTKTRSRSFSKSLSHETKEIETGRVEMGSHSDQSFKLDNTEFNTYYSWQTTWKILPMSQKSIMKEDLTVYCTNCGTKRKKDSFKFCPNCGTKF